MFKLNNKGLTLTEVIITFSILSIIMFSMLALTLQLKNTSKLKKTYKSLSEYKTTLTRTIEDDLIKNKFLSMEDCNGDDAFVICKTITFKNNVKKDLVVNTKDKFIKYDNIKYKIDLEKEVDMIYKDVDITFDEEFLTIKIPIWLNENDYGIKIIYPINL